MDRNLSVDILKFVMAFFVVALHFSFLSDINKNIAFFLNQGLFRVAVPMFLLINGYYFERITTKGNYIKWLKRIIFLYAFWTIIYSYYWLKLDIYHIVQSIFYGYFHLWYISGIICASLIIYKLRNCNVRTLFIIAFLFYMIGCTLQYLSSYTIITLFKEFKNSSSEGLPSFLYRNFLLVCMPFMLLGLIIKKLELRHYSFKKIDFFLLISILMLMLEVSFNLFFSVIKNFDILYSLFVVCPLLFIKIKQIKMSSNSKLIGLLSSSIYFIHPLIYFILVEISNFPPTIVVLLTFFISLGLSFPVIGLNKRISIL